MSKSRDFDNLHEILIERGETLTSTVATDFIFALRGMRKKVDDIDFPISQLDLNKNVRVLTLFKDVTEPQNVNDPKAIVKLKNAVDALNAEMADLPEDLRRLASEIIRDKVNGFVNDCLSHLDKSNKDVSYLQDLKSEASQNVVDAVDKTFKEASSLYKESKNKAEVSDLLDFAETLQLVAAVAKTTIKGNVSSKLEAAKNLDDNIAKKSGKIDISNNWKNTLKKFLEVIKNTFSRTTAPPVHYAPGSASFFAPPDFKSKLNNVANQANSEVKVDPPKRR